MVLIPRIAGSSRVPAQKPRPEGIETAARWWAARWGFTPAQKPRPEGIETCRISTVATFW